MTAMFRILLPLMLIGALLSAGCSEDEDNDDGGGNSGPTVLSGTITQNMTLTADNEYLLRGGVFIGNGTNETILTIEAGTTIYGESSTQGMLVINRGSRIMAEGTAQNPIVFTSDKPDGQRNRGDWGGLIINGRAPLNTGAEAFGEGGTGYYGGNNPNDNSGVLRYVRVEFAGREISPDNELNGIALQGVGSGTVIDYVQVHMNKDDGIEFFGGTVNAKHVYITGCADDQFDWTDGWSGKGQFWVCQQYTDDADRGIEADNNAENNSATPRSNPAIYNLTLIGARDGGRAGVSTIGMILREGTAAQIHNAIVMNFTDCGLDVDHAETFNQAVAGNLSVANSIFHDNGEPFQTSDNDENGFPLTTTQFGEQPSASNRVGDPLLAAPYNRNTPDFRPGAGSIARNGFAVPPSDGFFDEVDFIGGIGPNNNWIAGWTTSAQN